jgi:transcriptional regulator with XRE-family HTH domain
MSDNILIGQRLCIIRNSYNLNQDDFADKLGVSLRAYQNYERGERTVSKELICAFIDVLNIDPTWLLTGKGDMYRNSTTVTQPAKQGDELLDTLELLKRDVERAMEIARKRADQAKKK